VYPKSIIPEHSSYIGIAAFEYSVSALGALNHQTAHHLFPGIAQCFYPIVTPIVKQTCEEFGIEYHCCNSLWDAMKSHIGHLKQLGRDEEARNKLIKQSANRKQQ
jgi:fatty acid desaturase